jgi:hypothetical protein
MTEKTHIVLWIDENDNICSKHVSDEEYEEIIRKREKEKKLYEQEKGGNNQ